jgi:ABC-type transport system substrate-binding protein
VKVVKNDKWYGYTDGKHVDQYSIGAIDMPVVKNLDTQLLMFEQGQLDSISLRAADMKKYSTSPYLMYTPQSYTDKIALNSSFDKLKERQTAAGTGINKTIMSNVKFRQALSWALDRQTFVQTETAGSTPALGVINDMYVADEASGVLYRDTDAGKRVVTDIYGDSTDGFNLTKAKQLITEACTEEAAKTVEGHYATGDKVSLEFVVYNDDWKTAIQNHIDDFTAATVGTPLEGKFEVTMRVTTDNQKEITAGNAELCMDIWGGAQMNPYGIPDSWISADNRTCFGYNPDAETIDIDVNGDGTIQDAEKHTNTEWYDLLNNTTYSAAKEKDYKVRTLILSWLEEYMLKQQYFIAVRARNSVSIDSFRVQEGTDEYQALVGYGGIRSLKLTQDDATWAATAAKGLDYTK